MKLLHLLFRGARAVLFLVVVTLCSAYITMWLATDRDMVQLPRVIGIDATAATELLREQGVQPKVSGREFSEQVAKDAVLSQRPASGSWVRKNSEVRLIVSKGGDAVALPSLAGLPLADARRVLLEHGLTLGRVAEVHSPERDKGQVIAQDPEAGAPVRRGSAVALLVSLGQREKEAEATTPLGQLFRNILGGEGGPRQTP